MVIIIHIKKIVDTNALIRAYKELAIDIMV